MRVSTFIRSRHRITAYVINADPKFRALILLLFTKCFWKLAHNSRINHARYCATRFLGARSEYAHSLAEEWTRPEAAGRPAGHHQLEQINSERPARRITSGFILRWRDVKFGVRSAFRRESHATGQQIYDKNEFTVMRERGARLTFCLISLQSTSGCGHFICAECVRGITLGLPPVLFWKGQSFCWSKRPCYFYWTKLSCSHSFCLKARFFVFLRLVMVNLSCLKSTNRQFACLWVWLWYRSYDMIYYAWSMCVQLDYEIWYQTSHSFLKKEIILKCLDNNV